jgi:hypothetical protein
MSAEHVPPPDLYGPMPDVGTMKVCWFCQKVVTLRQARSGWHYWCADLDPVNGGRHCLGGAPEGNAWNPAVRTLHLPIAELDESGAVVGERWAYRYTPDGEGRMA